MRYNTNNVEYNYNNVNRLKRSLQLVLCFALILMVAVCAILPVASAIENNEDLRTIAKSQKFVKEASVLTFSNIALLSLRCDSIYFQEDKNTLKSEIIKNVKSKFPEFTKVYVKLDMDIFLKTKNIEKKLQGGASYFDLKEELSEVLALCDKRE